jgi:hypothetical protein
MNDEDPGGVQLRPHIHPRFMGGQSTDNRAPWDAPPFSVAPSYAVWALFNKCCENELTEEIAVKNAYDSWNKMFPKPKFVAESHGFYTDVSKVVQATKNWEIAKKTHHVHCFLKGAAVPIVSCVEKQPHEDVPPSAKWEFHKEKTLVNKETMERTVADYKTDKALYVWEEVQRFRNRNNPELEPFEDQFSNGRFESDGEL